MQLVIVKLEVCDAYLIFAGCIITSRMNSPQAFQFHEKLP